MPFDRAYRVTRALAYTDACFLVHLFSSAKEMERENVMLKHNISPSLSNTWRIDGDVTRLYKESFKHKLTCDEPSLIQSNTHYNPPENHQRSG
ncbi:hypothetical protein RvY_14830 [Ramazzottius varieornatus]|uniref:Uncharacterized protein n=1 Tax=Ramazzottius varieornatus TaxID=947166 RepID=A0A1D1VWC7_RAMVA|nr:hypothetical protein RvY_14830 [Ramazzottius varieornatus]